MSLPVAHQLILIEGSQSLFEWLVSTLFGLALALALDWHRTGSCGTRVLYIALYPLVTKYSLTTEQGMNEYLPYILLL